MFVLFSTVLLLPVLYEVLRQVIFKASFISPGHGFKSVLKELLLATVALPLLGSVLKIFPAIGISDIVFGF